MEDGAIDGATETAGQPGGFNTGQHALCHTYSYHTPELTKEQTNEITKITCRLVYYNFTQDNLVQPPVAGSGIVSCFTLDHVAPRI